MKYTLYNFENEEIKNAIDFQEHFNNKLHEFFMTDNYDIITKDIEISWNGKKLNIPIYPETVELLDEFFDNLINTLKDIESDLYQIGTL